MAVPLVLLSDFNIAIFERYLRHDESGIAVDVESTPFGQLFPSLTDPTERRDAVAVVWTRAEGVLPALRAGIDGDLVDLERLDREVDDLASLLASAASRHQHLLVASWVAPPEGGHGLADWRPGLGVQHAVQRANVRLAEAMSSLANAYVLDAEPWIRAAGRAAASPKQWFTSKVPYVNAVFQAAVPAVKAAVAAVTSAPRKLLVLDLDDTLWGGIVGDVGWQALRLGGHDHVGEAYVEFQRSVRALARRGVILGVVSKNTASIALEAIDEHPEMILRRDDLAGWRINWDDKAANVAALVEDLNLGLDAAVFIDDNPAERARVREALPDVLVPEWPTDPALFPSALRSLRCFDRAELTDEDRSRSTMYVADRDRRAARATVGSLDDWLASLGLRVVVAPVGTANIERAAQLLNKTNQMNLTVRRVTGAELLDWAAPPGRELHALSVGDRFGESGLTGVVGLEVIDGQATVTDLVLSCRVMGRGVEDVMLHVATVAARRAGATTLTARYVPTARNAPCLDFLRRSGLSERASHVFDWDLAAEYPLPTHVELEW